MLDGAYPRVQRHRNRGPQKRLCWRRAAASPGAARSRVDCGLVEVMGPGLITCGEEEVVRGVHTLIARIVFTMDFM